ncbi:MULTISPECIES: rod shape-determining protein RodA [unclassified Saccharibacter]|uniref:rod shape-determining protein RodA n=1 Tax=unclassified Saccharibacter TaxID=2648722 RepID=UPI0013212EA4|nr:MULTISPECIES: rod shape-determining protein RodA [unclassified Saccharibacter]MXV36075.1 rod shape-determining protein RodA [Saccharibacter sp. EH611]MXV56934.1 rod shape-determining protein RodA [Saccharibacter sp. EH70]MXV66706.1 rod shape-determining protein RodA [Saccharibacter sp. EH60]
MPDLTVPRAARRFLREEPKLKLFSLLLRINWIFVLLICLLAGVGYGALYSAGGGKPIPFAEPQLIRFGFGVLMMIVVALLSPRVLRLLSVPIYILSILMLGLVLKMGHVGKGAERWINMGGFQFQPSEFAKIALVLILATWFHRVGREKLGNPLRLIVPALLVLLPVILVLKEPNLGTASIVGMIGASLFFVAGMRWWQIFVLVAPIPFLGNFVYSHLHDYQKARIDTFLHPEHDPLGAGYNIIQSKIALGSGGIWGEGYLHGSQGQLNFLPEKQTDFIFTMIGEEWGYAGGVAVIVLLGVIVLSGMVMALRCRNRFGCLVGLGISVDFFLYCVVNLSMVMGVIPVGGVPLPLISYGGSAMLTMMFGFGLLLSTWVYRDDLDLGTDQQHSS